MKKENSVKNTIIICLMILLVALTAVGCFKRDKTSSLNEKIISEKSSEKDLREQETKKDDKNQNNDEIDNTDNEEKIMIDKNIIEFSKIQIEKNVEPEFGTAWLNSPSNMFSVSIDGKGPEAAEEGIGKLFVKDIKTGTKYKFEIADNKEQDSPKHVEWLNDEELLVIVGYGYGTVSLGGDLYKLNVITNKNTIIYDTKSNKEQVLSVKKINNNLELEILIYDDDNYNKSHKEAKTIGIK